MDFDPILVQQFFYLAINDGQLRDRCGTKTVYQYAHFISGLQIRIVHDLPVHLLRQHICVLPVCPEHAPLSVKAHSVFDLPFRKFKDRMVHPRQLSRRCGDSDTPCIVSRFLRDPGHLIKTQPGIAGGSRNLYHKYVSRDPPAVADPLLRRGGHVVPHSYMRGGDPFIIEEFLPHIKIQVVPCITSIYKEDSLPLVPCLRRLIHRIGIRRGEEIAAGRRVCQPFSHKSGEHGLMSASASDDQRHLILSVLLQDHSVYLWVLHVISSVGGNIPFHHFPHNVIWMIDNFPHVSTSFFCYF